MKILYITAFPPNQKTAGQDYSRRLIDDLCAKGYEISLIYSSYPNHAIELYDSVEVLRTIKPSLKNCLSKLHFHPFFTRRLDKKVLEYIQEIAHSYDILYFDFSQVHLYSLFIDHPCKVLMCHDVIAQKYLRRGRLQLPWIHYSEKHVLKSAKYVVTFSEKDCAFIKKSYNIDSFFVHFYLKNGHFKYQNVKIQKNVFCFYGAWNRIENEECLKWFLKTVYPFLNDENEFVIIGGGLNESLQRRISILKNIKYLGFVDNPVLEISKSQALIAPLRKGAGVKVKVIDALSSGTPVIGTEIAFEGISDNKINKMFHLAHSSKDYVSILNNWQEISVEHKQDSADEFFNNYNENHFSDMIETL